MDCGIFTSCGKMLPEVFPLWNIWSSFRAYLVERYKNGPQVPISSL